MIYDCIAIGAHPDDMLLGAGGTLAKLASNGKKILIVSASDGENGISELGEIRLNELKKSCEMLGVDFCALHIKDGLLTFRKEQLYYSIASIFVESNPQTIITHHSIDGHKDHRAVYDAVECATSEIWHQLREDARLNTVLSCRPIRMSIPLLNQCEFSVISDIGGFSDLKYNAVHLHESQKPNILRHLEIDDILTDILGKLSNCTKAEGFMVPCYAREHINKIFDF